MSNITKEKLLSAWLGLTLNVRGNRIVNGLSFNEIVICNYLYRSQTDLTSANLSQKTKLLKSQLNKILNMMEEKGLIERVPSSQDKRKVFIKLRRDNLHIYLKEHEQVMKTVSTVYDSLGEEKTTILANLLEEAVEAINKE